MTACELADKLQELDAKLHLIDLFKSADMLRQQADRIAELEKLVHQRFDDGKRLGTIETEDRLLKQSEPVAWGLKLDTGTWMYQEKYFGGAVPLYTTPQKKPLSDEEIIKIFNQIWNDGGNTNGVMHRFARAIEERHGIK